MTAEAFNFPWDFLQRVMNRIINEVDGSVILPCDFCKEIEMF